MLKIKDNARAYQFKGGMFDAVDTMRELGYDTNDRLRPVYEHSTDKLHIHCPVSDAWKIAAPGEWIVKTEGSRILIYNAEAFIFAFNE